MAGGPVGDFVVGHDQAAAGVGGADRGQIRGGGAVCVGIQAFGATQLGEVGESDGEGQLIEDVAGAEVVLADERAVVTQEPATRTDAAWMGGPGAWLRSVSAKGSVSSLAERVLNWLTMYALIAFNSGVVSCRARS